MTNHWGDKHPVRTLLYLITLGAGIFTLFLLVLHLLLIYGGVPTDPSIFNFYAVMAGLGVLFGFERWWGYEQGGYNPFRESTAQ